MLLMQLALNTLRGSLFAHTGPYILFLSFQVFFKVFILYSPNYKLQRFGPKFHHLVALYNTVIICLECSS